MAISYKDAGVDVERGYEAVRLMKEHVKKTILYYHPNLLSVRESPYRTLLYNRSVRFHCTVSPHAGL